MMLVDGDGGAARGGRPLRVAQWVRIRWWNACAWYAVTLAEALARRGHASFVLAPAGTPAHREAAARGLATPDVGDLGSPDPVRWVEAEERMREFLREERIDLVNIHSGPGHVRIAVQCRRRGIAVVRTRGDIRCPRGGWLQGWVYRELTDHHIASAEFIRRDHYADLGLGPERITTLRGGIDPGALARVHREAARAEVRRLLGLEPETPLVGMVARLSPVKGHVHFLNAMARVLRDRPGVHLLVAGPDAQMTRQDVAELAWSQGLSERTHVVGPVADPLLWSAALDVAVIASVDSEAICRSAFELLGLGVPLVATRVHAIPEVVTEGAGMLVPPADPARLGEAVAVLLDFPMVRASFAEAGRAHVLERHSLDRFGAEAEGLFRRLVRNGGSAAASAPTAAWETP